MKFLRLTIFLVFIIFLYACSPSSNHENEGNASTIESITSSIDTAVFQNTIEKFLNDKPNINGIILHVESPDVGISWSGATGVADTKNRVLKANDPALIASNTKTYVAASIMRLIENGHFKLNDPIQGLLTTETDSLMKSDGYATENITLAHLMSHTSGVFDYCDTDRFQKMTVDEPAHEWSKREQMTLAVTDGDPLGPPGATFKYADMNYLLLTEIIEVQTGQAFYTSMRELLKYEEFGINNTWFNILEQAPEDVSPLIHQFATKLKVDSYTLHGSFDLYGGGGIAATAKDLALFTQHLFQGDIYEDAQTLGQMHTLINTNDSVPSNYYMGFDMRETGPYVTAGHGGFWGTAARYCPDLNTTVVVYVLERDLWQVCFDITKEVLDEVSKGEKIN